MEGVTKKNPKKVEARKKWYQARMLKLKEEILGQEISSATTTSTTPGSTAS